MGIAPRRQADLFSTVKRGRTSEEIRSWTLDATRQLRHSIDPPVPTALRDQRNRASDIEQRLAIGDFLLAVEQTAAELPAYEDDQEKA